MFLALLYSLIIHQTVTFASPFHKYPYVFLLDIGNEELQTKSEQIRVSVPGGSLALRIPAIGEGDNIAHVRVSGIDFDNDLKANIVDGGPGYKYVVIVFMGNPGRAYDAVVTVSTLDNEKVKESNVDRTLDSAGTDEVKSTYKIAEGNEDEANDSAETEDHKIDESNEQLTSSSNFYDSAENEDINGKEDEADADANLGSRDELVKIEEDSNDSDSADEQDYADADDQKENNDYVDANAPREEKYSVNEEYDTENDNQATKEIDSNLYDKSNALRPHLYNYAKVPQEVNNAENEIDYKVDDVDGVMYSPEDPVELDQMFNDEEVHNDAQKYSESNHNNYDETEENTAVAY